jgi:hypothetical protein
VRKKTNSIQNASVLTNFLSDVLNSQIEKLPGDLQDFFMAGFQFREKFLLLRLKCDLLVEGQDPDFLGSNCSLAFFAASAISAGTRFSVELPKSSIILNQYRRKARS